VEWGSWAGKKRDRKEVKAVKAFHHALEIDGGSYIAEVKEKAEAWKKYKEAVVRGSTAGV
jgi:hypothetical protein